MKEESSSIWVVIIYLELVTKLKELHRPSNVIEKFAKSAER